MPPSVVVLSLSDGRQMLRWDEACRSLAARASASWASVSNQATYFWASFGMNGHWARMSFMSEDSANRGRLCLVVIHPPMPTEFPSAMASALARRERMGDMESEVVGMAWLRAATANVGYPGLSWSS